MADVVKNQGRKPQHDTVGVGLGDFRAVRLLAVLVLAAIVTLAGDPVRQASSATAQQPVTEASQPFDAWLSDLIAEARDLGFDEALLDDTLAGLEPLPRVITNDRNQAEVVRTFDQYLQARVTPAMIRRGQELAQQHVDMLADVQRTYDVPSRFLLAIWGIETRYGRITGREPIFQALATLAWEPRRSAFFRRELFNALRMVARGYIESESMRGSWAGAMGQPQFMPSSYLQYAVDFDGDGRRDIWNSTADALGSVANYLRGYGWQGGFTWGREVRLSASAREAAASAVERRTDGCSAMRRMTERLPLSRWQALGVRRLNGAALPQADVTAALVEVDDRTFLVYPNYDALLRYNCSHNYALTVAALADRLR